MILEIRSGTLFEQRHVMSSRKKRSRSRGGGADLGKAPESASASLFSEMPHVIPRSLSYLDS